MGEAPAAQPVTPTVASLLAKCIDVAESLTNDDGNVASLKAKLAEAALLAAQRKPDVARKFFEACESGQGSEACEAYLTDDATFTSQSKDHTTFAKFADSRKTLCESNGFFYTVMA